MTLPSLPKLPALLFCWASSSSKPNRSCLLSFLDLLWVCLNLGQGKHYLNKWQHCNMPPRTDMDQHLHQYETLLCSTPLTGERSWYSSQPWLEEKMLWVTRQETEHEGEKTVGRVFLSLCSAKEDLSQPPGSRQHELWIHCVKNIKDKQMRPKQTHSQKPSLFSTNTRTLNLVTPSPHVQQLLLTSESGFKQMMKKKIHY